MKKKKTRRLRRWTPAEVKQLKTLAKARHSARDIAKILKRSLGAVSQKALHVGVRFRSRG